MSWCSGQQNPALSTLPASQAVYQGLRLCSHAGVTRELDFRSGRMVVLILDVLLIACWVRNLLWSKVAAEVIAAAIDCSFFIALRHRSARDVRKAACKRWAAAFSVSS